jgi:hypothetical protein
MVGETEYETTITASVEPVIGDGLREQMAAAIRAQVYDKVGGKIDFSQVQDPSQSDSGYAEDEPKPTRNAKKKVVQEEEVEEQPAPRQPAPAPAPVRRLEKPIFTF